MEFLKKIRELLHKLMAPLHKTWVVIKIVVKILNQSRFSLIIVLLTVISLEYVGQIKDILVGLSDPESGIQIAFFVFAVNWLAFQSWGWARYIYTQIHQIEGGQRGEAGYQLILIDWLPRLYAMAAFLAAYRAAIRADVTGVAYSIVAVGLLVLAFLIYRRDIAKRSAALLTRFSNRTFYYFTGVVMAVTTVAAIWSPVGYGNLLGAGAVVFIGLGSIIPTGTVLVSIARENGFPVVGALLLLAVIFSPFNDNHHVRYIEGQVSDNQAHTLEQSLEAWLEQRDETKPMVLVATAGGGLRASYWTGVILGRFQDKIPQFNKQLFAVSGVSGGSVGAVFYNGALASDAGCVNDGNSPPCFEDNLLEAIGQDYLAATATSMLYGDLIQRFLPFSLFSDRAAALEQSWEVGFARTYPESACGLDVDFNRFFPPGDCAEQWLPRLLINGTYEESGRRLLTTSFKVEPSVFLDTHDFYQLNNQKAIRASTAALNSARFTYMSPAGTFGETTGHVIDGGYFENYGANTLTNLIDWLKQAEGDPLSAGLIVITISNDSGTPLRQYDLSAVPEPADAQRLMNEFLAPIVGLAATRGGHGMLAFKQLEQYTNLLNSDTTLTEIVHFYIAKTEGQPEPPLGWILSHHSKKYMREQITEGDNCEEYKEVLDRFGSDVSGEQCTGSAAL